MSRLQFRKKDTIRPETDSNDFDRFRNYLAVSNSIFFVADFFLKKTFRFFVCLEFNHIQCVTVHVVWPIFTHRTSIPNVVVSSMILCSHTV